MRLKKVAVNLLLIIFSIFTSIIIAESFLRFRKPYSTPGAATELTWMRNNPYDLKSVFMVDSDFGFRPILGNSHYNEYGTKPNNCPIKKKPKVTRLLFIGDSVTQRGRIIDGLKFFYGENEFEYWNAGV